MENTKPSGGTSNENANTPEQKSGPKIPNLKLADFSAPSKGPAPQPIQDIKPKPT